jgi:hypothetical protein
MELVTMILACSLYPDNSITNAMLEVGSHNNPLAVTVDGGQPTTFKTADQAAQFATAQIQQGHKVDVGLMQIPNIWLKQYPIIPSELFMGCKNTVLATKILNDAETQCSQMENLPANTSIQTCALSVYKTGDAQAGLDYANAVVSYSNSHSFSAIQAAAEAKNPAGFHMIPGDAPTTATTKDASKLNPTTDKVRKKKAKAPEAAPDTASPASIDDINIGDTSAPTN